VQELEVLLALCKAAPLLADYASAERLADQLIPYTHDAHVQTFVPSPHLKDIEPSPTEALSYNVTSALLSLGISHDALRPRISQALFNFLNRSKYTTNAIIRRHIPDDDGDNSDEERNVNDAIQVGRTAISILGFLDAAASYADFWNLSQRIGLINFVRSMLSQDFLVATETAFSAIRNSHSLDRDIKRWKKHLRHYAASGRPLGAMLLQRSFMWLLVATSSLMLTSPERLKDCGILELMTSNVVPKSLTSEGIDNVNTSIETLTHIANEEMGILEDGADYLRLGSVWQKRLAFSDKAALLTIYINCVMLNDEIASTDTLMTWLENTLNDPIQMADDTLAATVLRCMALLAKLSPVLAPNMSRLLPRFIVQGAPSQEVVEIAGDSLAFILGQLSSDAVISTMYTLGNVLTPGTHRNGPLSLIDPNEDHLSPENNLYNGKGAPSTITLQDSGDNVAFSNVVRTIRIIAQNSGDDKIRALAQSMLLQKVRKVNEAVDATIIYEAAILAANGTLTDLRSLLKSYNRLAQESVANDNQFMLDTILKTRNYLSRTLRRGTGAYGVYIEDLLETIISKGDVHQAHHTKESDVELAATEIATMLQPLALLVSSNDLAQEDMAEDEISALMRDAWFNMVVHGFSAGSERAKKYSNELRILAIHSKPLVNEQRGEQIESDIELNSVLRRGMSPEHEAQQKKRLSGLIPANASEIRGLSYRKVIFLQAAYLVESLRAEAGDCSKVMIYFLEPAMRSGDMSHVMESIMDIVMDTYLRRGLSGVNPAFSTPYVARQLVSLFCGCCHRIARVQQAAIKCTEKILASVTSSLCQKSSLFAFLELLSLMWLACLEGETDEYEWKSTYTSVRGKVTIHLSDDYEVRRATLNQLYKKGKIWVTNVINIAPQDVKGLLQTYLSEYNDDGAYGHISLGRSFAAEMGGVIPVTDQRLGAIDRHGDANINTMSDFIAQYSTRQAYRYAEALPDHDVEWLNLLKFADPHETVPNKVSRDCVDTVTFLTHLESRMRAGKFVPIGELRDVLRRAAALLCRSKTDECALVKYLVSIPFAYFSKQTIKLGISLWISVINENPRMEPRILMEVAQQWEETINKKRGIFHDKLTHPDPFYEKEEYAPSDRDEIMTKHQAAYNMLAPHSRLLHFLSSHFSATRLLSPHVQRVFTRMLRATLEGLMHSTGHPLSRELRFQIILFGLRVLRYGTALTHVAQWRLKDQILSAALSWFAFYPKFSFGSNRLQVKTETRLLSDVATALKSVSGVQPKNPELQASILAKEELLVALISNEQMRLKVWLNPLQDSKDPFVHNVQTTEPPDAHLMKYVRTAWEINPSLAVYLTWRYRSPALHSEVRNWILSHPAKAIDEPEALNLIFDGSLPPDVSWQLKYLLYWAPVNPVTAITYFLPAYSNHPSIIQYAMRALESHPVDVTFFYVPQVVQSMRYDALGYIERYIIETAKFSQLFAHQIIWNMKANSYKGDDETVEDAIKPALDRVQQHMINSFSGADREFFEREFHFFDEVTGISGTLRAYLDKSKPEKKQKIEEELRKIKLDVGVYLPSNPDGVVVGIDRKSGKPLQSHAKTPFMATFRIRKDKNADVGEMEDMIEQSDVDKRQPAKDNSIEIWQSAIFKVGDDCRQDVLALQMIAAFRGVFNTVGLDVYVYPYRVTATAPGCGVIDVLPNSVSRDMLGREAVNGLYDYFVTKYGNEDSVRFQEARNNFVKSMAAYSIISFLLQFKDRHNGNIMVDDHGHILHIDFGFCFDIAPGGVKFERAPFKLTSEMVAVMGGSPNTQSFRWFEELCVKAFLASRMYVEKLSQIVLLMMDSGLPCFKPESIKHFKERFVLEKSEREASNFVRHLVKKSYSSYSTGVYDQFQLLTNGIPY
jgi:phosphatidylinositol 4-kinase